MSWKVEFTDQQFLVSCLTLSWKLSSCRSPKDVEGDFELTVTPPFVVPAGKVRREILRELDYL